MNTVLILMKRYTSMYGMNRILSRIGRAAVAVDGLIPTDAFLEFQACNVLVFAFDIRQLEDIEYTPAPDILSGKRTNWAWYLHPS